MKVFTFSLMLLILVFCSCNKSVTSNNPLQGTAWNFSKATGNWNFSVPNNDSVYLTFVSANRYEYRQYNAPLDKGSYTITQDSLVSFQPDDSTYSSFYSFTHFTLTYNRRFAAQYAIDNYSFSIINANQLVLNLRWTAQNTPNYTSPETYIYNKR